MKRLQALKIAYKQINAAIETWIEGIIDYLPIDVHWDGNITVGDHLFLRYELMEYQDEG